MAAVAGEVLGCLPIGWRLSGSRHAEEEYVPRITRGLVFHIFMTGLGDSFTVQILLQTLRDLAAGNRPGHSLNPTSR